MRYHDPLTVEIFTFFLPKKIHCCAFSLLAMTSLRNPWDQPWNKMMYSLAARRGRKRALIAVAHANLILIHHMLSLHQPYHYLRSCYLTYLTPHVSSHPH